MSFFNRLFGGGDSKKPQEKPVEKKEDTDLQKKIEREKVRANIEKQLRQFDDKEKKLEVKVNSLKQKAKEYLSDGKQKQGRKYLAEAARLNKQIEQVIVHKKAVLENVSQLQAADMTAETAKILEETKKHLDEHQKNSDKLMDLIQEANLRKREQEQMHEQMKMLVENDDDKEAEDEMLDEIMQEIKREKAKQQKLVPGKEIGVKVPQQKVKPVQERDEIEDMLNGF